ncbi:chloride channel protein [Corynebacterium callunae]|uniref:chloride channel protein n=1 Tax=Corynebacterium callunae TaxID=1721 RepID=UPI0039822BE8
MAVIIGIGTGLFVVALKLATIGVEHLVYGADHLHNQNQVAGISPLRLAITIVVLGFVSSWAWYFVHRPSPDKQEDQPTEVSVVGAMRGEKMPFLRTLASAFLQTITVAAGSPTGAENAPRIAGSWVAEKFSSSLQLDLEARRILVAAAAGAGLGASFHLPLAGVLFTLEVLLAEATTRAVVISIITTAVAVASSGYFVDTPDVYNAVSLTESPGMLLSALIVGAVAGLCGHGFSRASNKMAAAAPKNAQILWLMPLGFSGIAVVAYFYPLSLANPRWVADTMLSGGLVLGTILLLLVLRTVLFLVAFRVGMVGGNLLPAFTLGTLVGGGVGTLLEPVTGVPVAAFALLGAAAFLSTTMSAPLFGLIAAVEFTDMEPQGYLSIFLAVAAAIIAVRLWLVITQGRQAFPVTYASWTGELK